ncbi:MAG TPA: HEAT repeat domain-containing protein [Polyangiaceae bacterium]|nr:HEAT repeat domain-containing protein [Polyangiaceae bacterium]
MRRRALLSLADRRAVEASGSVVALLDDEDPSAAQFALVVLGELGAADCLEAIRPYLEAVEPAFRFQALQAWARLAPNQLAGPLAARLEDTDPKVRLLALRLLEEWLLDTPGAELDSVLEARVQRLASDADRDVALVGQLVGAELGLQVPHDQLIALVNRRRSAPEPRDEQGAIEFCGRQRLAAARAGLASRARGAWGLSFDPFRFQALAGLAALGDVRAHAKLEKLLRGRGSSRALAVFAIGRVGPPGFRARLTELASEPGDLDPELLREALAGLDEAESPPR